MHIYIYTYKYISCFEIFRAKNVSLDLNCEFFLKARDKIGNSIDFYSPFTLFVLTFKN